MPTNRPVFLIVCCHLVAIECEQANGSYHNLNEFYACCWWHPPPVFPLLLISMSLSKMVGGVIITEMCRVDVNGSPQRDITTNLYWFLNTSKHNGAACIYTCFSNSSYGLKLQSTIKKKERKREQTQKIKRQKREEIENKAENWENGSEKKIDADVMRGQILRLQTQTGGNER